jgi:hypothetical protein
LVLEGTGSTGYARLQRFASASCFGEKRTVDYEGERSELLQAIPVSELCVEA